MPLKPIKRRCTYCRKLKLRGELVRDLEKGGYKKYCRDCKPDKAEKKVCVTCGLTGTKRENFVQIDRKPGEPKATWSPDCKACRAVARAERTLAAQVDRKAAPRKPAKVKPPPEPEGPRNTTNPFDFMTYVQPHPGLQARRTP